MYKYSRSAQDKFFDFATFAFLFAWFEANPQARQFSSEKFAENDNPGYLERMTDEIAQLGHEAQRKLEEGRGSRVGVSKEYQAFMTAAMTEQMRRILEKYLLGNKTKWSGARSATKILNGFILFPESKATSAASASPIKPTGCYSVAVV